jgi:hypothetical protein
MKPTNTMLVPFRELSAKLLQHQVQHNFNVLIETGEGNNRTYWFMCAASQFL